MLETPPAVFDPQPVQTYRINNAYQLTGIRSTDTSPQRIALAEFFRDCGISPKAKTCLIQFRWSQSIKYLSLQAAWSPLTPAMPQVRAGAADDDDEDEDLTKPRPSNPQQALRSQPFLANEQAKRSGASEAVWKDDLTRYQIRAAEVPLQSELSLDWRLDTESPEFLRCEELTAAGIIDLDEPQEVKVVQLKYDRPRRRSQETPHSRIHIYGSVQIDWRETITTPGKQPTDGPYKRIERRILIEVVPGLPLDEFDGYAAIDFGNTNSTFACVSADAADSERVEFILCEGAEPTADATQREIALNSAVRLHEIKPAEKKDSIAESQWTVGNTAMAQSTGQLLLGGKRLLADPNRDEGFPVILRAGEVKIPKELPAELLLTSMLRGFYSHKFSYPQPIGVTYPTTFSDAEIERTREAVFKALRRSGKAKTYLPTCLPTGADYPAGAKYAVKFAEWLDHSVPRDRMLDEATAAAFYFIHRDFIRGPGRMPAAFFEYPYGINLLLYDCGGGTTDVALIHCRIHLERKFPARSGGVPGKSPATEELNNTWRVSVKVLGRTGHRDFGGDNINIASFKVLKATLAQNLAELTNQPLDWNTITDEQVPQWLSDHYEDLHPFVPTNWISATNKGSGGPPIKLKLNPAELQHRQRITLNFWKWAEQVKVAISKQAAEPTPQFQEGVDEKYKHPFRPLQEFRDRLVELILRHHSQLNAGAVHDAIEKTYQDPLIRRRIDALIQRDVQRTIDATNSMIDGRLQKATRLNFAGEAKNMDLPQDSVVHWVYVVGKASHYPTIQESLAAGLNVQNLQPPESSPAKRGKIAPRASGAGRLRFERDVLKSCVAGGAALAMATAKGFADIKLDFDRELSQRIPYSVGFESADGKKVLYQENLRYSELTFREIPVAEQRTEKPILWLYRQWPGQESYAQEQSDLGRWEQFMRFDFREAPVGPIKVEFGPEIPGASEGAARRKTFIMTDTKGKRERVVGKEVAERTYVSPPQRGDL